MDVQGLRKKIIIVGAGPAGLAAAIRFKQSGENDFLILERAAEVGGVWRENRYPGCACDVRSHLFSFSFAPKSNWTRDYAPRHEIHDYLKECVDKFCLEPYIHLECDVQKMTWQEDSNEWLLETTQGVFRSQFLVAAPGSLSEPFSPSIPGLERFAGTVVHSARWPEELDVKNKNVVVLGTGASAIQIIPELQKQVAHLTVFQSTPAWVLPRNDRAISNLAQKLFGMFPVLQKLARLRIYLLQEFALLGFFYPQLMGRTQAQALEHMHSAISDLKLREVLTPDYTIGCKRILLSDEYYPALSKTNVTVVSGRPARLDENHIYSQDGQATAVDVLVMATGFEIKDHSFGKKIFGLGGRTLAEVWTESADAYMGTTVAGFPNLAFMQGPNTGLGHTSVLYMIEAQIEHILKVFDLMKKKKWSVAAPRLEAQRKYAEDVRKHMRATVWVQGGCSSWYLDKKGANVSLWPRFTFSFRKLALRLRADDYEGRE